MSGVLSFFFSILYILIHLTLLSSLELSGSSTTADDRSCSTAHTGSSSQVPAALVDCCKLVLKGLVSEQKLKVGYKGMIIDLVYLQTNSKVHSHSMYGQGLVSADRCKVGQQGYNH